MRNTVLPIDLKEDDNQGIWPWVIAAVTLTLLAVSLRSEVSQIPRSILSQAHTVVNRADVGKINVDVDGRDLTVNGTINPGAPRDAFVESLARINGVRVVNDDMREFDPRAQAKLQQQKFQSLLTSLDLSKVAFEQGSASLTQDGEQALRQLVQVLRAYPQFRVRISGHTDNTGRAEVNLRISRQRARAVADFLATQRVNPTQLISQGYGATRPIADNSTESGRAANRRIEISYVD